MFSRPAGRAAITSHIFTGEFTSSSPEETFNYGHQLGARLEGGEILLLSGPLGAGKTIFVKGICAAIGVEEEDVTSPSFTLVNPHAGRVQLYHIDLYRLDEGASAAHAVDLDDLLSDEKAVLVIEWAERMGNYPLPDNVFRITIEGDGASPRTISIWPQKGT
ncbi:MAG TPA: tRNA (adenosine(37)-N6)-threonylcarbamoyltransferase complex ATPase subunit type 1 TsaE [Pyrinomonadaceae bacterium]|nr:tRNA (adenosine(37)-N6)-threonylcarbamoyltransferase complex ATPase subunit type 1 TsaE [Pyrinomonadaceae bacterium]